MEMTDQDLPVCVNSGKCAPLQKHTFSKYGAPWNLVHLSHLGTLHTLHTMKQCQFRKFSKLVKNAKFWNCKFFSSILNGWGPPSITTSVKLSFCMMLKDRNPFKLLSWKFNLGSTPRFWVILRPTRIRSVVDKCICSQRGLCWFWPISYKMLNLLAISKE